jgi:hypothetical protein
LTQASTMVPTLRRRAAALAIRGEPVTAMEGALRTAVSSRFCEDVVHAQAAQKAGLRAEIPGYRQAALLRLRIATECSAANCSFSS